MDFRMLKPLPAILIVCSALWTHTANSQDNEPDQAVEQTSSEPNDSAEPNGDGDSAAEVGDSSEGAASSGGESGYEPVTTVAPAIPLDQLTIIVKPLTKSELDVEAEAWLELLRTKARQISAYQLAIKKLNEVREAGDADAAQAAMKAAETIKQRGDSRAEMAERQLSQEAQKNLGLQDVDPADADQDTAEQAAEETDDVAVAATDGAATETEPGESQSATETAGDQNQPSQVNDAASEENGLEAQANSKKEELLEAVSKLQDERAAIADRLEVVLSSLEAKGGEVESYRNYAAAVAGINLDANDASAAWAAITGWLKSKEGGQRWGWNIAKFTLILLITWIAARLIAAIVNWLLERKLALSQLAEKLVSRSIKDLILVIGFAIALTALEVNIGPILAAIGAAGFIIGFALQDTLSNFASGLMILLNRPFDEGDVVTAGGVTGVIDKMNLVSTTFRTFDNQTIHVPNNEIWNKVITNITANDKRRVDLEFGIGYEDDFEEAERIIREVVAEHELVLSDPEPQVVTHELADSSVNIVCRPWSKTSDWWTVKTDITRQVKRRFDEAGISIPFPQRDIHVYQHAPQPTA